MGLICFQNNGFEQSSNVGVDVYFSYSCGDRKNDRNDEKEGGKV